MSMVRISEDIYKKVKEISEKSGKSIKDIVEEAIQIYLLGKSNADKDIKSVKEKWIVSKFPTKCSQCNKEINQGELVYWVRIEYEDGSSRSFIYCDSCYFTRFDRSLAKRYLKIKELEATRRGLEKEINEMVERLRDLQFKYRVEDLKREVFDFYKAFQETFNGMIDSNNFAKIQEFLELLMQLIDEINRLEASLGLKEVEKPIKKELRAKERVY